MTTSANHDTSSTSRRRFLKSASGALTVAALAKPASVRAYAGEDNTIKIALIGCGGRGTGAADNALSTAGPTKLWAMADVFGDQLATSLQLLTGRHEKQINVPDERQFVGIDGFRLAIDSLDEGDVVLLATPPAFRPIHLEYAVQRNRNVFMEKSFAVDAPGVRRVLQAGELAKQKNLKIAGGLMSRHYQPLQEAVQQIHDGIIGDVITCWAYRKHTPVGCKLKPPEMSEMAHQIRNYSCYTWLNGSFMLDWLIHNLDVACWVKNAWPVAAQGDGGRQLREQPDQLFDHYSVEYRFADGTRLVAQGRHMTGCWDFFGDEIHGTKGCAVLGEGVPNPRIYQGHNPVPDHTIWRYRGPGCDPYQAEHDLLFDAIRQDKTHNEAERCAYAAMTGILGRMAAESGAMIPWDQALASNLELAPGLDTLNLDSTPPVTPNESGQYPIAMPGITQVL